MFAYVALLIHAVMLLYLINLAHFINNIHILHELCTFSLFALGVSVFRYHAEQLQLLLCGL